MRSNGTSVERSSATGTALRMPETFFDQLWVEPLTNLGAVNRTVHALLDSMASPAAANRGSIVGHGPAIDLYEKNGNYVVEASVPGYRRDEIDIEVTDNHVTISGDHKEDSAESDARYHYREVRRGTFSRTIAFPHEIDAEKVKADYKDGILMVTVPGSKHASPKKVAIAS